MKRDYAFIEFEEEHHAKEAIEKMDGKELDGHKIIVQVASAGRGKIHGPTGADVCFNCGRKGHW